MRKYQNQKWSVSKNQRGATAIIVGASMFALVGIAAFVVDLGNIYVARNELHNAVDAGALAGARKLYNDTGTVIHCVDDEDEGLISANAVAHSVAIANFSQNQSVEVNWTLGTNGVDVQRGHWSFDSKSFTANPSCALTDLWGVSTEKLDADTDFINAVRVVARRQATPVASFFAKIFGYEGFEVSAEAVGYIGFSGKLAPGEVDQPIAICEESLEIDDEYSCNIGRMLNSGADDATHNTAGWTNFSQPCATANAAQMATLVCNEGNPEAINYGEGMGATGGVQQATFNDLKDCWIIGQNDLDGDGVRETPIDTDGDGIPDQPWNLTLPVISCPGNNVANCAEVKGAVNLNVIWITDAGTPDLKDAPEKMADWSYPADAGNTNGQDRWNSFVSHFALQNADNEIAPYAKKSIYFLPDCTPHLLTGTSGGENFGVLARIPVLVH